MRQPGAVLGVGDAHRTDRPLERDTAEHERRGRGVDGDDVVRVLLVGAHDGADHLGLVAIALGEARPQGPVDQPAREDGLVARTALPTEERAGNLAGRVHPLFDVDGEGEEINALPHALVGVGGDEHKGVADPAHDGALGLGGESSGLERQGLVGAADRARYGDGFRHGCSFCFCCERKAAAGQFPVVGHPERSDGSEFPTTGS